MMRGSRKVFTANGPVYFRSRDVRYAKAQAAKVRVRDRGLSEIDRELSRAADREAELVDLSGASPDVIAALSHRVKS